MRTWTWQDAVVCGLESAPMVWHTVYSSTRSKSIQFGNYCLRAIICPNGSGAIYSCTCTTLNWREDCRCPRTRFCFNCTSKLTRESGIQQIHAETVLHAENLPQLFVSKIAFESGVFQIDVKTGVSANLLEACISELTHKPRVHQYDGRLFYVGWNLFQ